MSCILFCYSRGTATSMSPKTRLEGQFTWSLIWRTIITLVTFNKYKKQNRHKSRGHSKTHPRQKKIKKLSFEICLPRHNDLSSCFKPQVRECQTELISRKTREDSGDVLEAIMYDDPINLLSENMMCVNTRRIWLSTTRVSVAPGQLHLLFAICQVFSPYYLSLPLLVFKLMHYWLYVLLGGYGKQWRELLLKV